MMMIDGLARRRLRNEDLAIRESTAEQVGLQFYDLSHPWGLVHHAGPTVEDAKSNVLHGCRSRACSPKESRTVCIPGQHIDGRSRRNRALRSWPSAVAVFLRYGEVVVSIPKKKLEVVTAAALENRAPDP